MPRRSSDSEKSGDHNWRRLWETPSKKSQRRYARAWVHLLLGDLPISRDSAIPKHPTVPSEFTVMTTNPANLNPEDQLLSWRQEMEARQEEQTRQMAELQEHANQLREENWCLRTQLEVGLAGQLREPPRSFPPSHPSKGKEVTAPDDVDLPADDELSSDSSPLPRRSPSPNAAEAHSRKRPPRRSRRSVSVARHRVRREPSGDQRLPTPAHQYVLDQEGGFPLPMPSMYPPYGAAPMPQLIAPSAIRGPQDMLSTPLGQHILDYDPPRSFSIPPFAMYDGSSDPYDHMLHYNQAMILSAGDDRLLCKVFPASLKGPALAWLHKLPRGSINTFGKLWAAFVSQYLCSVR